MNEYIKRRESSKIHAGKLAIGGGSPVSVQSMTNIPIEDTDRTIAQINLLESLGADMVRLAIRNEKGIEPLKKSLNQ